MFAKVVKATLAALGPQAEAPLAAALRKLKEQAPQPGQVVQMTSPEIKALAVFQKEKVRLSRMPPSMSSLFEVAQAGDFSFNIGSALCCIETGDVGALDSAIQYLEAEIRRKGGRPDLS